MEYLLHILILVAIYTVLAASLDLVAGHTGLMSIAHAAFFGVGAYVAALMALRLDTPFLANMVCAALVGLFVGTMVGVLLLRIRDDYFAIATLAFQVITFNILNSWMSVTGGPMGIPGIPKPSIVGHEISSLWGFFILAGSFCACTVVVCWRITDSPFGRVLHAIREDEIVSQSAGKNVGMSKLKVFAVAAAMAAVGGVLYAYHLSFIDPRSFTVMDSIFVLSVVIVGGAGSRWGPVLGAMALVSLPEVLRFVGVPAAVAANVRQMLYGGALVACMMWRPQGIVGKFAFERRNVAL